MNTEANQTKAEEGDMTPVPGLITAVAGLIGQIRPAQGRWANRMNGLTSLIVALEGLRSEDKLSEQGKKVLEAAENKAIEHINKLHPNSSK